MKNVNHTLSAACGLRILSMSVRDVLDQLTGESMDSPLCDTKLAHAVATPEDIASAERATVIGSYTSRAVSGWLSVSTASLANSPPLFKLAEVAAKHAQIVMPLALLYGKNEDRSPKSMNLEASLAEIVKLLHEGGFNEFAGQWESFARSGVIEDASLEEMALVPFTKHLKSVKQVSRQAQF